MKKNGLKRKKLSFNHQYYRLFHNFFSCARDVLQPTDSLCKQVAYMIKIFKVLLDDLAKLLKSELKIFITIQTLWANSMISCRFLFLHDINFSLVSDIANYIYYNNLLKNNPIQQRRIFHNAPSNHFLWMILFLLELLSG
jgi:hypothetical protein